METSNSYYGRGMILFLILGGIGSFSLLAVLGLQVQGEHLGFYIYLLFAFLVTYLFYLTSLNHYNIDLFEPYHMFMIMSLLIYVISPMVYIINNDTLCHGKYVMDGCIKGTTIYLIAIVFFNLGYFSINRSRYCYISEQKIEVDSKHGSRLTAAILLMWIICYVLYMIYTLASRKSILYILSFGIIGAGNIDVESSNSLMKFLLNFSFCMVPLCLYIYVYSRNKILKISVFLLTISAFYINGSRFIIIILLYEAFTVHYILKQKRPRMKTIVLGLMFLLGIIVIVGATREGVRGGSGFSLEEFNVWDGILTILDTNFNIYQVYYSMVAGIPSAEFPFTFGRALIIDPLIMFIPRALWPDKPGGILLQYQAALEGKGALAAYMAPPNLPELYMEFGVIGVAFILLFVGRFLSKKNEKIKSEYLNVDDVIEFSTYASFLFQFIIRGYFASNFWMIVFAIMSIKIVRKLRNSL